MIDDRPLAPLLPHRINHGPWVAGYSLDALKTRVASERVVLPVCSLGTAPEELARLGPLVLPPLYHEAFARDPELKSAMVARIRQCFPFYEGTRARVAYQGRVEVVELPERLAPPPAKWPRVLGFGVDTTIEQHALHLPLATDTIQTYAVLQKLAADVDGFVIGPPLDYGQLTWGLPFGMSIDVTAALLGRYARGFIDALLDWCSPAALFVADVHGSLVHRETIQDALRRSRCARWAFRWLHDPLGEFAGQRGDMHAGGVETALVSHINPALVDALWWPLRAAELEAGEMTVADAAALSGDLKRFIARVESEPLNGIVGKIANATTLPTPELFRRMLEVARGDVDKLLR